MEWLKYQGFKRNMIEKLVTEIFREKVCSLASLTGKKVKIFVFQMKAPQWVT